MAKTTVTQPGMAPGESNARAVRITDTPGRTTARADTVDDTVEDTVVDTDDTSRRRASDSARSSKAKRRR